MERNTIDINLLIGTYVGLRYLDFRFSIVSDLTVPIINSRTIKPVDTADFRFPSLTTREPQRVFLSELILFSINCVNLFVLIIAIRI